MIKTSLTALLSLSLVGCFSFEEKTQEPAQSLGERDIKYYSNKTVSSLEIPPDLTKPSLQNAFKLENYVSNIQEDTISFSKKDEAIK